MYDDPRDAIRVNDSRAGGSGGRGFDHKATGGERSRIATRLRNEAEPCCSTSLTLGRHSGGESGGCPPPSLREAAGLDLADARASRGGGAAPPCFLTIYLGDVPRAFHFSGSA